MNHPAIDKFVKLGLDRETAEALVGQGIFTPAQAREHPGLVEAAGAKAMTVLRVKQKVEAEEGEAREVEPVVLEKKKASKRK
jgi:hypothetical protein